MALMKRLTVLAGAAGAVSYVRKNPEKVNEAVGKAARFVDAAGSDAMRAILDTARPAQAPG